MARLSTAAFIKALESDKVTLVVGSPPQSIAVHKDLLRMNSEKFTVMLSEEGNHERGERQASLELESTGAG